jgi:TrmH family RNA methyltransferase
MHNFVPEASCFRDFFMLSKNQIRHIQSLRVKKQRELRRQFIAEGTRLVLDLLNGSHEVTEIYASSGWIRSNPDQAARNKGILTEVTEGDLGRITALSTPAPVLAVVAIPETENIRLQTAEKLILLLDDIRDPGNLGTIIRIADWFGIDSVVCSDNTVDLYNPKVVQATMGSIARVPVYYRDPASFLETLPAGTDIFGAFLDGENIYEAGLPSAGIVIIGNEASGISHEAAKFVTRRLHIPSFGVKGNAGNQTESLNASIATAIICSEFRRRN